MSIIHNRDSVSQYSTNFLLTRICLPRHLRSYVLSSAKQHKIAEFYFLKMLYNTLEKIPLLKDSRVACERFQMNQNAQEKCL